jgi:hypothetical protein
LAITSAACQTAPSSSRLKALIAGRYNHATYQKQVKQALEAWAQTIRNVADGVESSTNVIPVTFGKQSA